MSRTILLLTLTLGVGCRDKGAISETGRTHDSRDSSDTQDTQDTHDPDDSDDSDSAGAASSRVPAEADVVVVGSGPAGLTAAISALETGADVLMLERSSEPGLGAVYAGQFFAAGTDAQLEREIPDSIELAASEWESITGVSGDNEGVMRFLEEAPATLDWLATYGVEVQTVSKDVDSGSLSRMHVLEGEGVRALLLVPLIERVRLEVEVNDLLVEDGAVVGVTWTDLRSGQTGETRAGAVVAATGGFLRDRARVDAARAELSGRQVIFETNPQSNGGGLAFMEAVGATSPTATNMGIYVHGLKDPDYSEGEAMVLTSMDDQLLVTPEGTRFADEGGSREFSFFEQTGDAEVFMVTTGERAVNIKGFRPAYNWASLYEPETFSLAELEEMGAEIYTADTLEELATAAGIDPAGLATTVEAVNALIATGGTDEWGRTFGEGEPFESDSWWGVHLRPGLAKAFGGISADADSRVLDGAGVPIPGLYAAGEVVGMIPEGGAGSGFAGSVGACYTFGRLAGASAGAEALGE